MEAEFRQRVKAVLDMEKAVASDKMQSRKKALQLRNSLSQAEIMQKSSCIAGLLTTMEEFKAAKLVMCYLSFGSEVSTWELARYCLDRGKRLVVPRIVEIPGKRREMIACEVTDLEAGLQQSTYGIMEPISMTQVPEQELNLIIVPGLLFNNKKYRLGYGGGYYDRFLKNKGIGCSSIGIFFELQHDENIPVESHDLTVDKIITENRTIF